MAGPNHNNLPKSRSFIKEASDGKLYKKQWLVNQREELQRRLVSEAPNKFISAASKHFSIMGDVHLVEVEEKDLENISKNDAAGKEAATLPSSKEQPSDIIRSEVTLHHSSELATSETWLARLIRYMTVGTLDLTWEVRHGCAMGLSSILKGLYVESNQFKNNRLRQTQRSDNADEDLVMGNMSVEDKRALYQLNEDTFIAQDEIASPVLLLPSFIANDIICCGMSVLMVDRFMDFSGPHIAPVKEVAAEMVSFACASCDRPDLINNLQTLLFSLCFYSEMNDRERWIILYGGLLALKYFCQRFQVDLTQVASVIAAVWNQNINDDLNKEASNVLFAVEKVYFSANASRFSSNLQFCHLTTLLDAVRATVASVTEFSACALSLMESIQSCCLIAVSIHSVAESNDSPTLFHVIQKALETATQLLSKSYLFSDQNIHSLLSTFVKVLEPLKLLNTAPLPPLLQQVFLELLAKLITQIAVSVLVGSVAHVGDIFLVSKEQHNSSNSSADGGGLVATTKSEDQGSSDYSLETYFCDKHSLLRKLVQAVVDTSVTVGINADLLKITTDIILRQLMALCAPITESGDRSSSSSSSSSSAGAGAGAGAGSIGSSSEDLIDRAILQQVKVTVDNVSSLSPATATDVRVRGSLLIFWNLSSSNSRNEFSFFFSELIAKLNRTMSLNPKSGESCNLSIGEMLVKGLQNYVKKPSAALAARSTVPTMKKIRFVIKKEDDGSRCNPTSTSTSTSIATASTHCFSTKKLLVFQISSLLLLSTELRSLLDLPDFENWAAGFGETYKPDLDSRLLLYYRLWCYSKQEQVEQLLQLLGNISGVDDEFGATFSHQVAWSLGIIIACRVTSNAQPNYISSLLDIFPR